MYTDKILVTFHIYVRTEMFMTCAPIPLESYCEVSPVKNNNCYQSLQLHISNENSYRIQNSWKEVKKKSLMQLVKYFRCVLEKFFVPKSSNLFVKSSQFAYEPYNFLLMIILYIGNFCLHKKNEFGSHSVF